MSSIDSFNFIHLTDPHLSSLDNAKIQQLLNKRILGFLSWKTRRRHVHLPAILNMLINHMQTLQPDHVVVSGDLTHIGLPQEFDQVAEWLPALGAADRVTIIPGNHETYVRSRWQDSFAKWVDYLTSDQLDCGQLAIEYPTLRIRKHVAFIGLNSAYASAPFLATGRLGKDQLVRLRRVLDETARQGLFRVVIVHHPPLPGLTKWRKRLIDARQLQDVLFEHGAELVLFGHTHNTTYRGMIDRNKQVIPIFSLASASSASNQEMRKACFTEFRVKYLVDQDWDIKIKFHQYEPDQNRVIELPFENLFGKYGQATC